MRKAEEYNDNTVEMDEQRNVKYEDPTEERAGTVLALLQV